MYTTAGILRVMDKTGAVLANVAWFLGIVSVCVIGLLYVFAGSDAGYVGIQYAFLLMLGIIVLGFMFGLAITGLIVFGWIYRAMKKNTNNKVE